MMSNPMRDESEGQSDDKCWDQATLVWFPRPNNLFVLVEG